MSANTDLKRRLELLEDECRRLKDIEAIKSLKARYWYCVDNKLWDEVAECFAEESDLFGLSLTQKKSIAKFYKRVVEPYFTVTVHQGHNPEIELVSDTEAKGRWQLDQFGIEKGSKQGVRIGITYQDRYVKEGNAWKIKSIRTTYIYREVVKIEEFAEGMPRGILK